MATRFRGATPRTVKVSPKISVLIPTQANAELPGRLTERDDRNRHGDARTRSILLDRPRRHVQVHIDRLERVLALGRGDPQVERVRADPGERDVRRFRDDVAERARQGKLARAWDRSRLDAWPSASQLQCSMHRPAERKA